MRGDRWHKFWRDRQHRRVGGKLSHGARPARSRSSILEPLESRLLLTLPAVVSIDRSSPPTAGTGAEEVAYLVTFNAPVTNVSNADFNW